LFWEPSAVPVTLTETEQDELCAIVAPESATLPLPAVAVAVPPQVELRAFGVETTKPAGSVSVKATAVFGLPAFGLLIVIVSEVLLPIGIDPVPNALVTIGASKGSTATVAVVKLLLPWSELTCTTLVCEPVAVPVTLTETAQEALCAIVAPEREMLALPAVAAAVPPQVELRALGVETTRPAGRESVKATLVFGPVVLGLLIVIVIEVLAPIGIDPVPNALVTVGASKGSTATVADAKLLLPWSELTCTTLVCEPVAVPVTLTETAQEALCAIVVLERETVALPAVAVAVPPQVELKPLGVETTRPAGSESVKATPVFALPALGLVIVIVSEVVPPIGIDPVP
jgi:hypothetical protein